MSVQLRPLRRRVSLAMLLLMSPSTLSSMRRSRGCFRWESASITHVCVENQRRLAELKRLFELEDAVSLRRKRPFAWFSTRAGGGSDEGAALAGGHLLIAASSSVKAERLRELFREHRLDIPVVEQVPDALLQGRWERERWSGITRNFGRRAFLMSSATFGSSRRALFRARANPAKKETRCFKDGLQDLKTLSHGDPIIHVEHGIGRYQGLTRLNAGGRTGRLRSA